MAENTTRTQAGQVITYLLDKGFNTPRETASDCGLTEVELDACIDAIDAGGRFRVYKAGRPDSSGHQVLWLENA